MQLIFRAIRPVRQSQTNPKEVLFGTSALAIFLLLGALVLQTPGIAAQQRDSHNVEANFFVSPTGRDTWSGTLSAPNREGTDGPFASIEKAKSAALNLRKSKHKGPVTVVIRDGMYFLGKTLEFTSGDSGSENAQLVFENYPGETPVISGGVRVENWKKVSGNRWETTLPTSTEYFEQLFYNGERR